SVYAAKTPLQIGRSTSENNRHLDTARNRDPAAATDCRRLNRKVLPAMHQSGMTRGQISRTDACFKIATAPAAHPVVSEAKSQSAECNSQSGRRFLVADKKIRHPKSVRI